jgi:methenyltetrahydromethanopterin cyclohydrolase
MIVRGESLSQPKLSVNLSALSLVKKLCAKAENYGVTIEKTELGATIIDAGVKAKGGFSAGKVITEICLGGQGKAEIFPARYGDFVLPSVFVQTDHPAIATLGAQFAGWQVKIDNYSAIGSGPARALALKPRELYEKIEYKDTADVAVLVLEASKKPPKEAIKRISDQCKVVPKNLFLIIVPTTSLAGSIQISGRIVETGLHKLMKLGLDPRAVKYAWGYAPIAPVHPRFDKAMGRTNDAILYMGTAHYMVSHEDDEKLRKLVQKAPSSASKSYGRPFLEIFERAGYDFYKIDSNLFAPAVIIVNNLESGKIFRAGNLNVEVFEKSLEL